MADVPIQLGTHSELESGLPPLWLHPLHAASDGITPMLLQATDSSAPEADIEATINMAKDAVRQHRAVSSSSSSPRQPSAHRISLGGLGLLIHALDGSEEIPWQIPLRFSEVAHFQDAAAFVLVRPNDRADPRLIDSIGQPSGAVWIIGIGGDQPLENTCLFKLLTAMGAFGAMRFDLHDAYKVSDNPIDPGSLLAEIFTAQLKSSSGITPTNTFEGDSRLVAVKVFRRSLRQEAVRLAAREVACLVTISKHPNIVRLYGLFRFADPGKEDLDRLATMVEFFPEGALQQDVCRQGPCSEWRAADVMVGLLSALSHLHARRIVHRDVKPESIHLKSHGEPTLYDFQFAANLDDVEAMRKRCGTPGYCAPEIFMTQEYGAKADVFSSGVVLYFILSGKLPFSGASSASTLRRSARCNVNVYSKHLSRASLLMKTIILQMLFKEVNLRPDASDVLKHLRDAYSKQHLTQASCAWQAQRLHRTVGIVRQSSTEEVEHVRASSTGSPDHRSEQTWDCESRMTWPLAHTKARHDLSDDSEASVA